MKFVGASWRLIIMAMRRPIDKMNPTRTIQDLRTPTFTISNWRETYNQNHHCCTTPLRPGVYIKTTPTMVVNKSCMARMEKTLRRKAETSKFSHVCGDWWVGKKAWNQVGWRLGPTTRWPLYSRHPAHPCRHCQSASPCRCCRSCPGRARSALCSCLTCTIL